MKKASDMTVEEFKQHLADMKARMMEINKVPGAPHRSYLNQKRGRGIAYGMLKRRR